MDNREAQFLLHAYRPGGADVTDPLFAAPLEAARLDPTLERWFAESRAFDTAVAAKLREAAVPAGLREAILASGRLEKMGVKRLTLARVPRSLWAVAAAFALFLGLLGIFFVGRPPFPAFENALAGQIASGKVGDLAFENADPEQLKAWLAGHGSPSGIEVPTGLRGRPAIGCRTFTWRGRTVSQVCFALENGGVAHLFVVDRKAWQQCPPSGHPQIQRYGDWKLASWEQDGSVYVLAREGDVGKLF